MKLPFEVPLNNKVAVVTGGSGVLGSVFSKALAQAGATVVILARDKEKINSTIEQIEQEGGKVLGYSVDVLNKNELISVHEEILKKAGPCSILINGAGGNNSDATTKQEFFQSKNKQDNEQTFFDIDHERIEDVFNLNYKGALLPTQVFAKDMIDQDSASIINISSMNAYQPFTKIPAYSGAIAAISNFTQCLAVYFSKTNLRVNALAPGFFLTEQNKNLMFDKNGDYSSRANKIISQTPVERFGEPEELIGTLLWLVDHNSSGFINGIVVPVDGGFSAYSGV